MSSLDDSASQSPVSSPRTQTVWVIVLFLAYLAVGNVLFFVPVVDNRIIQPWTRVNAKASAAIASALGVETRSAGTVVSSGQAGLNIMQGCNGAHALLLLLSSILAFPAPWSRRLIGIVAGTVVLLTVNVVRIVNLIVVARYFPDKLELFHLAIWQTLIVFVAVALFLGWGAFLASRGTAKLGADLD